jgi:uncharacterized protein involved in exopolysaccharide biosynthesis
MYNEQITTEPAPPLPHFEERDKEFDLLRIAAVVRADWKTVARFAVAAAVLTAIVTFFIKPTYTAVAQFLPPNSMSTGATLLPSASMLNQLGAGASTLGALRDPTLLYIGVLQSRTIADDLIQRFDLASVYKTTKLSQTEKALKKHTKVLSDKSTITTVSVEDHDPKRAADLANAYLEGLRQQSTRLALTEAGQKRLFFEQQIEREKNSLADAEVELARTQQKTGLIQPSGQAQLQMQVITQAQAEIALREVQLANLGQGATEQNPEIVRIRSEIAGLRAQLKRLEDANLGSRTAGDIQVPTSKVPELSLLYLRKSRDVRYHEELYALLLRQLASAQLDESRSAPMVQVVDYALVPDSKSWPPRALLTLAALILGALAGACFVVLRSTPQRRVAD